MQRKQEKGFHGGTRIESGSLAEAGVQSAVDTRQLIERFLQKSQENKAAESASMRH